jgi:hypothetical protein
VKQEQPNPSFEALVNAGLVATKEVDDGFAGS